MNSFRRFGIEHLSASSLNLWRGSPGVWALRYVGGIKDAGNAAMWRGTAVENGLAAFLRTRDIDVAKSAAFKSFYMNSLGLTAEDIETERLLINPMIDQGAKWQPPSDLNATQLRIEHWFDQIPIPVIGYLDFAFDGIDIDLKTTKACPSSPRADHVRQVSLYRAARGRAGGLLYLTDKKHAYYEIDDAAMEGAVAELRADCLSLNNFLARCDSRGDVLKSLPVDWTHWSAPKTKMSLEEILAA